PQDRHPVPGVPPDPDHDRARERRGAARAGRGEGRLRAGRGAAGRGRALGARASLSRPAVRRRAATGRARPGALQPPRAAARRRADRQPRPGDRRRDHRAAVPRAARAGHDPAPDHPRAAARRALHPSAAHGRRPTAPAGARRRTPARRLRLRRRMSDLALAWRLARRELRAGVQGFVVFLACLTLGVAAIAAVGVINAGVADAVKRDAAALLGGDIRLEASNLPIAEDELAGLLPADARRSDAVRTNAMAFGPGERRVVVALKAVDEAYPLYGAVELDPAQDLETALADGGAVVEPGLLARLGIRIGDPIRIGEATFTVRGTIVREPDRLGGFVSIGPRVMIRLADLARTEVIV